MTNEQIDAIKERIMIPRNNKGIYFGRVPQKEWEWFTNWCDEEFEGDYGMGLKWLAQGYMPPIETELMAAIEQLTIKVQELESQLAQMKSVSQEKKTIKLLNGKELNKELGE